MNLKIRCEKDILLETVNIALKAIPAKTTNDILNCLLIIADENGLKIISNNLEMGIETTPIEVETENTGSVAVDAKLFYEFLKSLPDDKVLIECIPIKNDSQEGSLVYNYVVNIVSGKTKFKLKGANADLFPIIDKFNTNSNINISSNILKNMIRKTIFSTSTNEKKPEYTGELFVIGDSMLKMAATDTFRYSLIVEPVEINENYEFIIPSKTLNELIKILPDEEEDIEISLADKNVMFSTNKFKMNSRLIEGKFIKPEVVMPREYNASLKISRDAMIRSFERAFIISRENTKNPVKMEINEDIMKITSISEKSDFYEEIMIEKDGQDIEIAVNPRYIIESLKAMEDEYINILLIGTLSPIVLTGTEDDSTKYMILPTKM